MTGDVGHDAILTHSAPRWNPLRWSFHTVCKVRERASYEYALVSAAASVVLSGDRVVAARIALGSVAQRPWRLPAAEAALVGKQLKPEHVTPIIAAAMAEARPLARNGYKVAMARNAAVRALCAAGGLA
jgi:xanthine dehydrogenase YagS FAD-binding subunit